MINNPYQTTPMMNNNYMPTYNQRADYNVCPYFYEREVKQWK